MTDKEVMQMALDALESLQAWPETPENFKRFCAVEALRTAIAQPEKEWLGLTDDEIREGNRQSWVTIQGWESAVWWAEEKLKEKNT